jgi:DNA-binding SARP family transcriptional activator/tetratricopeptide (TPR) repeat protein
VLQVTLLGEQIITDDVTGIVRTRSSRSIALIAYLSAHPGSPQPRQLIAGLFWPDSTDAQALTNLRRELHLLRHILGDDTSLSVGATTLSWHDVGSCRVDLRVFDDEDAAARHAASAHDDEAVLAHARVALAAYTGELLPGVGDDWVVDLRSRLARRVVELCDLVADAGRRTGDLTLAVEAARRRIRLEPVEEIGYRTLMTLQAERGDRAGAISAYHHCASVLERELGLDPDAATQELLLQLLGSADAVSPVSNGQGQATSRAGRASAPLVGRDGEFERLLSAWRVVAGGRPQLALVSGEAGVGKTRLVAEIAAAARAQGAVVASTQCFGTPGHLPLAPVADWLRDPAVGTARAGLSPVWRAEVERLVPSGVRRQHPSAGSRAKVDAWQRHRFFEGLARALTHGERPIMLVLDNLQWCDEETLSFLTFCLGLRTDAPLLVAATVRADALDHDPLAEWVIRLRAAGLLTETRLEPLAVGLTANLAEILLGRPLAAGDAQTLQETTGGFPLYVVEASRATGDGDDSQILIGGLPSVLRRRLEQATPMAREIAGLAAAVGRDFGLDLITEASDRTADDVVRAIDELWRLRIVKELPHGYDFSHDLLRDAAYSQVSPAGRWLLHRRVAQGLELLHTGARDDVSAQLAEQYARGGLRERAMSYYQRAAEVAAGTFANAEAVRLYRKALAILHSLPSGRSRDVEELGIMERLTPTLNAEYGYSSPQLQDATERCLALAEGLARTDSILTSLIGLWTSRFVQGQIVAGHELATRALSMLGSGSDLEGQAHFAFAGSSLTLGKPAQALRHFDIACERSEGAASLIVGSKPGVHALAWSAHAHWLLGHDAQARAASRDAIALAREVDHPYSLAVALAYAAVTAQMGDDRSELGATVAELGSLCERYGFAYYREWGVVLDGWMCAGPAGIRTTRRGIDTLKAARSLARMPYWLCLLADVLARDGRYDAARATLDAALVDSQSREDVWWLPEVMRVRARYDDADAAVARLRAGIALARRHGSVGHIRHLERDLADHGTRATGLGVRPAL